METQSLYPEPAAPADAPKPESASVFEDFLDIFYAPSQVFERRRDGKFGLALLILIVVAAVLMFALKPAMQNFWDAMGDMQVKAAMASNPNVTPEMADKMRSMGEKFALPGVIFSYLMITLLTGFVLWIVGKIFDSKQTISQAMMVSTYAQVPRFILGTVVLALVAFFMGDSLRANPFGASLGLAHFFGDGTKMGVMQLASRVELFTIWATILLGIGLSITGQVRRSQAFIAAFIVWVIGSLPALFTLARGQ